MRADFARSILAAAFVALVVIIVYLPVGAGEFVQLDDPQYVIENPLVRNPSWESVRRFFAEIVRPSTVQGYYQPLTMLSLMADTWLYGGGAAPYGYHFTNVFLHAVNAVLLYSVTRCLTVGLVVPVAAALLFGLHPAQVESVAWISQRKTVLAAASALLSLRFYVQGATGGRRGASAAAMAAFGLALLAKPTVLPLPLVYVLLDFWPLRRFGRATLLAKWPYAALMAVAAVVALVSQTTGAGLAVPDASRPAAWAALWQLVCHNSVLYARLVFWPTGLSLIYPLPEGLGTLAGPLVPLALVVPAAVAALWFLRRRWPAVFVATASALILVGPTLGPIRFMQSCVGNRFLYLPLAVLALVAARALRPRLVAGIGEQSRTRALLIALGASVPIALLGRLTIAQQDVWLTNESLWAHVVRTAPDCIEANYHLAYVRFAQGRESEALALADRTLALQPERADARRLRADVLLALDRPDEALVEARAALGTGLGPLEWRGHFTLGRLLLRTGDLPGAAEAFARAIHEAPAGAGPVEHYVAGEYLRAGRADLAMPQLRAADEAAPDEPAIVHDLAAALVLTGDLTGAAEQYERAIRLRAAWGDAAPDARLALGKLQVELGALDDAERNLSAARVGPFAAEAELGLACVRAAQGRADEAVELLRGAISADPSLRARAAQSEHLRPLRDHPDWDLIIASPGPGGPPP